MKRGNPSMNKPSLNKIDYDLNRFEVRKDSKNVYLFECPQCGNSFFFKETDLNGKIIKCNKCGYEEIFFRSLYEYVENK